MPNTGFNFLKPNCLSLLCQDCSKNAAWLAYGRVKNLVSMKCTPYKSSQASSNKYRLKLGFLKTADKDYYKVITTKTWKPGHGAVQFYAFLDFSKISSPQVSFIHHRSIFLAFIQLVTIHLHDILIKWLDSYHNLANMM